MNSETTIVACQTTLRTLKRAEAEQVGIPKSEHFLNIVNGTPRLANLGIDVNGKHFGVGHPEWQRIDTGSALREASTNAITSTGKG